MDIDSFKIYFREELEYIQDILIKRIFKEESKLPFDKLAEFAYHKTSHNKHKPSDFYKVIEEFYLSEC